MKTKTDKSPPFEFLLIGFIVVIVALAALWVFSIVGRAISYPDASFTVPPEPSPLQEVSRLNFNTENKTCYFKILEGGGDSLRIYSNCTPI